MCVVPNGDIYPCHQFVGQDEYVIGNVYDGVTDTKLPPLFRDMHVLNKPICCDCWAKILLQRRLPCQQYQIRRRYQNAVCPELQDSKESALNVAMYIQAVLAMRGQKVRLFGDDRDDCEGCGACE